MADEAFYKHLKIYGSKGAPAPDRIREIEMLLEVSLPVDFLEFLNAANGGYFEYCVDAEGDTFNFGNVYHAGKDASGNYGFGSLVGEIERARRAFPDIPMQVVPFARDGGGSYVFLDLTETGGGRVVAFVQGLPEWTGKSQEDRFIEIAPSFGEFIDMHYECPDMI